MGHDRVLIIVANMISHLFIIMSGFFSRFIVVALSLALETDGSRVKVNTASNVIALGIMKVFLFRQYDFFFVAFFPPKKSASCTSDAIVHRVISETAIDSRHLP